MMMFYDIEVCFARNVSMDTLLSVYWYLFLIELPRYYLLEIFVSIRYAVLKPFRRRLDQKARFVLFSENPLVTILVPGKNEGKNIFTLIESIHEQTYQNYELIVVDDGSDDATPYICRDLEKNGYIDLYLRLEERGGKAAAANLGARFARGKYIVHLDADSSLDRDAIEKILIPFYTDDRVKAVGGCVKVRNARYNICTSLQALEYLKTIMVGRMVTSELGIYHIISGAFGAFERETLERVGYWDIGPGLDGDITQKLRKAGHKVVFANQAVCMTNVPKSWTRLYIQRRRWSRSLVRFRMRKHFDILVPNRNWRFINWLSNMESIFYDCICNYLWFYYLLGLLFTYTEKLLEIMVVAWIIRLLFTIIAFGVILLVTERRREEFHLIKYLPLSTFYTGYFLRVTRFISYTTEFFFFRSYRDSWNPRKTSVWAQAERN
ncbi:MAG: glycosyltransferase family 2 protein [Prevotellaceae bacterium]|nr:glycosyltransferase family 2 protein [Prevotellaceae bacterium]